MWPLGVISDVMLTGPALVTEQPAAGGGGGERFSYFLRITNCHNSCVQCAELMGGREGGWKNERKQLICGKHLLVSACHKYVVTRGSEHKTKGFVNE